MDKSKSCLGGPVGLFNRLMPITMVQAPLYPEGLGEQLLAIGEGMRALFDRHGGCMRVESGQTGKGERPMYRRCSWDLRGKGLLGALGDG